MKAINRSTDKLLEKKSLYKNQSAIMNEKNEFNILKMKNYKKKIDKEEEDSIENEK